MASDVKSLKVDDIVIVVKDNAILFRRITEIKKSRIIVSELEMTEENKRILTEMYNVLGFKWQS